MHEHWQRRGKHRRARLATALAGVALAAATGCSSAIASTTGARGNFRLLVPSTVRFESDSERFIAWQVSARSAITLLDLSTGRKREVAGCNLFDIGNRTDPRGWPAAHGRFIVFCERAAELLDAYTGTSQVLPGDEHGPSWSVVGARYVEGTADASRCHQSASETRNGESCIALFDIASANVSYRPQSQVANLDLPGAPLVCPPLRRKVIADVATNSGDYSNQLFGEPGAPLRLWHCHGRPTFIHRAGTAENLNVHGGLVSWDNRHDATRCPGEGCSAATVRHATVSAYSLATRRRWALQAPRRPVNVGSARPLLGAFGYSAHTRSTLVWVGTRTLAFSSAGATVAASAIYVARL